MAPTRPRKQRMSNASSTSRQIEPSRVIQMKASTPTRTPERSPKKQLPCMTVAQKQALIDNLQLEITERARKLRAEYSIYAQNLRSRLEMRFNRIPQALRAMNILELINKYSDQVNIVKPTGKNASKHASTESGRQVENQKHALEAPSSPPYSRGTKRLSTELTTYSDKENTQAELNMPKKRAKAVAPPSQAQASSRTGRTVSRKIVPSQVLSPRSNNSHTLPHSSFKAASVSPHKSFPARPTSPIKPSASAAEKPKAKSRTASRQAQAGPSAVSAPGSRVKRAAGPTTIEQSESGGRSRRSNGSSISDSSAATTIITKKKPAAAATTSRRGAASKAGTAPPTKRAATTRKDPSAVPATGTGGRVLRTRR